MNSALQITYRFARRIVIAVVGTSILLIGVAMLVTPGPAIVVIPIGLAILGIEFAWARIWLRKVRRQISRRLARGRAKQADSIRAQKIQ